MLEISPKVRGWYVPIFKAYRGAKATKDALDRGDNISEPLSPAPTDPTLYEDALLLPHAALIG